MKYTFKHTLNACYLGYITQAIVNNLAPLLFIIFQKQFGISYEMIGRLVLVNFGTQLAVDYLAIKFIHKVGYRRAAMIAHIFCGVGLICLGVLPQVMPNSYVGLTLAVVIYAIGGGLIEVLVSPIVDSLPGDAKASAMSLLHSFYCWGHVGVVILTTVFLSIGGVKNWFWIPILWSIVPFLNFFNFAKVPLMDMLSEEEGMSIKDLFSSKVFLVAAVLMICAGASEQSMSQWSSLFAEEGLGVPKMLGDLLGPCLFALLMGTSRLIYGIYGEKIHLKKAMMLSAGLCIFSYCITVFSPNPFVALLGCAITGFSVGIMWPGVFSLASSCFPQGGTAMFGILALMGDLGCSVGPWIAGVVSDQSNLRNGLFASIIFPVFLLVGIMFLKQTRRTARAQA